MQIEFSRAGASLVFAGTKKPSITGARGSKRSPPRSACRPVLQAPLADPLWLLARQWQFNEFQGEDAGTPLAAEVRGKRHPGRRLSSGHRRSRQPWQPLEARRVAARDARRGRSRVARPIPVCGARRACTLCAWRRAPPCAPRCSPPIRSHLEAPTDPDADPPATAGRRSSTARTIDAATARRRPATAPRCAPAQLSGLPAALDARRRRTAMPRSRCSQSWFAWLGRLVYEGAGDAQAPARPGSAIAWSMRSRCEPATSRLRSDEYTDGHVDWDDFRRARRCPRSKPSRACRAALRRRAPSSISRALSRHARRALLGVRGQQRQLRRRRGRRHRPPATVGDRIRAHLRQRLVHRAGAAAGGLAVSQ